MKTLSLNNPTREYVSNLSAEYLRELLKMIPNEIRITDEMIVELDNALKEERKEQTEQENKPKEADFSESTPFSSSEEGIVPES